MLGTGLKGTLRDLARHHRLPMLLKRLSDSTTWKVVAFYEDGQVIGWRTSGDNSNVIALLPPTEMDWELIMRLSI